ncbi:hypothetical protein BDDG_05774 [Blastomyces dermatitidis ATCC 18188]|uniref:SP-RING-type domain-containing protein n=1 Tax=Ajellomyces dermatitidis (strain ATCC 18188 / CBS 674.68) TaxID=653446 RepID=F2THW7_AJEDA|nr:hypothetical protein BDDG_05774 [Blastomyces dermatitidis ATCC 18188]
MSVNHTPRTRQSIPSRDTPLEPRSNRPARRSDVQGASDRRQGQPARRTILQLPTYQPQVAPLNATTIHKLGQLQRFPHLTAMQTQLKAAAQALTECAGMVNDRLADAKAREARRTGMKRKAVDVEDDEEVEQGDGEGEEVNIRIVDLEERVKTMTGQLEEKMRQIVDAEARTISLTDGLNRIHQQAVEAVAAQPQAKRRRMRRRPGEESEEDEGEDQDDGELSAEEAPQIRNGGTSKVLRTELKEKKAQWKETSLTDRYTTNDKYIGFYRVVHESKYPGDEIPPLPHPSTWFADVEQPTTATLGEATTTNTSSGAKDAKVEPTLDDSDDLAIRSERVSLRCPITLLPFTDPVKSMKCPHSFERTAIVAMIERSKKRIIIPSNGKRVPCVECPVCSVHISMHDLDTDVVTVRRLRRAEERREREEEQGGEEDSDGGEEVVVERPGRKGKGKGRGRGRAEANPKGEQESKREESREPSMVPDTQMVDLA